MKDVLTQMKLLRLILKGIGVSAEAQALIGAWFFQTATYAVVRKMVETPGPKPLRSTQGSLETAFRRHETARVLVAKARSFEAAPQRLLGRILGKSIVRRIDALYATTEAYLRSDSLYEEAVAKCSYERSVLGSDLYYMAIVGQAWAPTDLALIARHMIAGADPFKNPAHDILVFFGYDEVESSDYKDGYRLNVLILAPEWVCGRLRGGGIRGTSKVEAVNTCVDTVVAFWQKGTFNADLNILEARNVIKIARQLDTPRPQHQKVS